MPAPEPLRAAVFGGSFDPIHEGHLEVARRAQSQFNLERILFVPAGQSPFKMEREPAAPHLRLAMTMIATALENSWEVLETELSREGPSFTYDTLLEVPEQLRYRLVTKKDGGIAKRQRELELFLIIGSDNLPGLPGWKNAEDILSMAQPIVVWRGTPAGPSDRGSQRDPGPEPSSEAIAQALLSPLEGRLSPLALERLRRGLITVPPAPWSSTEIRRALREGRVPEGSLHPEIASFIVEQGLYDWPAEVRDPFAPPPEPEVEVGPEDAAAAAAAAFDTGPPKPPAPAGPSDGFFGEGGAP